MYHHQSNTDWYAKETCIYDYTSMFVVPNDCQFLLELDSKREVHASAGSRRCSAEFTITTQPKAYLILFERRIQPRSVPRDVPDPCTSARDIIIIILIKQHVYASGVGISGPSSVRRLGRQMGIYNRAKRSCHELQTTRGYVGISLAVV